MEALLGPLQDAADCADLLYEDFDLETAVGDQLDTLGAILGINRTVSFEPTDASPILNDETYRIVLKAKIVRNHWNGQIGTLKAAWDILFPGQALLITDNQDMTMDVMIIGDFTTLIQDLITNGYIVPKPQGVETNYGFPVLPSFGYDLDTDYVAGYESGSWFAYA